MRLFALSDLHVNHAGNLEALDALDAHPDDWLILAGDLGERPDHLHAVFSRLAPRWGRLLWVPGNHELWTTRAGGGLRGVAQYQRMVEVCRHHDVFTPEDPWPRWPGHGAPLVIAPLFLLYDYTFSPDGFTPAQAIQWAREDGIACADEHYLHPDPYPTREAWCAQRVADTRARLEQIPEHISTILVNHWPLREDLCHLFRIPRFTPWCGTRQTEDWHERFRARVVVSGHLHMRATEWRDGVRFEEVSLGYPRHWSEARGVNHYLRQVWPPVDPPPPAGNSGPRWRR